MNGLIIVDEHGDLEIYPSADDACLDLEAIDVRNEEYIAYDEIGDVFKFEVERIMPEGRSVFKKPNEKIVIKPLGRNDRDELAMKIALYLEKVGVLADRQGMSLEELVASLYALQRKQ